MITETAGVVPVTFAVSLARPRCCSCTVSRSRMRWARSILLLVGGLFARGSASTFAAGSRPSGEGGGFEMTTEPRRSRNMFSKEHREVRLEFNVLWCHPNLLCRLWLHHLECSRLGSRVWVIGFGVAPFHRSILKVCLFQWHRIGHEGDHFSRDCRRRGFVLRSLVVVLGWLAREEEW